MTDKQIGEILNSMVIIVDTREQKNQHIIDYLTANNIMFVRDTLKTGDYSFYITHPEYNHISKTILVERKNSLDEIAGNLTAHRERFIREFERSKAEGTKLHILIENATWKKLMNGSYRSKFNPQSFMASLLSKSAEYDIPIWMAGKDESPILIYNLLYYGLRNMLKEI